jgi:hypothetical protein
VGKIQVKPEDLRAAAAAVGKALTALSELQAQGKAAQTTATQIHYEPAAGKADAVAQKATENLALAHDALLGLQRGFLAAAGVYLSNDQLVKQDNDKYAASAGTLMITN